MKILVTSHYGMRDAWHPCQEFFKRFWKDCPYERILVTDEYIEGAWDQRVISFGTDEGYSKNLLKALQLIDDEQVLLIMEDMFINDKVNTDFIKRATALMEEQPNFYGMMRLYPCPGSDIDIPEQQEFGGISRGAAYRVSCMAAMWQKKTLMRILPHTTTAWDFELSGTEISRKFHESFFAVRRDNKNWPLKHFATGITRGVWEKSALDFCERHGVHPMEIGRNVK